MMNISEEEPEVDLIASKRDVRLDTSQPLDIRIRHDDGDKSPG